MTLELDGIYCSFKHSHDGHGIFLVRAKRTLRTGRTEYVDMHITMTRSGLVCLHRALKEFAEQEAKEADRVRQLFSAT